MTEERKRLTVVPQEAAEMIGVSLPTMYELCRRADFPTVHIGRKILIPIAELEIWLAQQAATRSEA